MGGCTGRHWGGVAKMGKKIFLKKIILLSLKTNLIFLNNSFFFLGGGAKFLGDHLLPGQIDL